MKIIKKVIFCVLSLFLAITLLLQILLFIESKKTKEKLICIEENNTVKFNEFLCLMTNYYDDLLLKLENININAEISEAKVLKEITSLKENISSEFNYFTLNVDNGFQNIEKKTKQQDEISAELVSAYEQIIIEKEKSEELIKNYEKILSEQNNLKNNNIELDITLQEMKLKADELYKNEDYYNAYNLFNNIGIYEPTNFEVLEKKIISLFLINKADSSKYSEILEGYKILLENGITNSTLEDIIYEINLEKGL